LSTVHTSNESRDGSMNSSDRTVIALDVSCLIPRPLTGVGYYTTHLLRALFARDDNFEFRLFATSRSRHSALPTEFTDQCSRSITRRWPTRLKVAMWTRLEWPPIEWFTGRVDIAHGAFHLLPAARHAKRATTVFDLSGIHRPETHTAHSNRIHRRMLEHAVREADALIAISQSSRNDLVELFGAPPERTHVVYGGVFVEEFAGSLDRAALDELKQRFGIRGDYFVHLGTIEPRKNIPRLLDAYARIHARVPDCPELVLAGKKGWMCEATFETIERLGLTDSVIQTGYVTRQEAVLLLQGAYACVYPSLYEGFGLPVLEAMAARTPVLTSNVSSLPEVIGDTGIQVDPESVDEIEQGLSELIDRYDAALDRVQPAYERATEFTWDRSAAALDAVYRTLA